MKTAWKVRRLGEVGSAIREQAKLVPGEEYELWSVPSFECRTPEIAAGKDIGSSKLRVRPNDVLICKINPRINRVWLVAEPENGREQIGSTEWLVFRAHSDSGLSPRWLIHYLSGPQFREWIVSEVSGATGSHTRAKTDGILRQEIPMPPLDEQRRIVGILDEAFAGIAAAKANYEANLRNARALFESHLQSVFSQRGEGWAELTLGEACERITDGKHGDCEAAPGSGFYFLSAKDVKGGTLNYKGAREITQSDFEETHRRTNLEAGDILVTNSGTIGRMAIAPVDARTDRTTFQKSVAILKPLKAVIDSRFAYHCLSSGLTRFVKLSAGTAQKNLLLRDLRAYRFSLPRSLQQQRRVAEQLDALADESQRLESIYQQKLDALEALKKSLLHDAFRGAL